MNIPRKQSSQSAFTLIEMLTVITIIGILASMAFPVVTGVMERARKVKTLAVIKDLQVGIKGYLTEYNHYPSRTTDNDVEVKTDGSGGDTPLIAVLLASDSQTELNGRGIKFVDLPIGKNGRGGLIGQSADDYQLLDEWGEPYTVIMDTDSDEKVANPDTGNEDSSISSEASPDLPMGVAIYSLGPDGPKKKTFGKKAVTSWRG